MVNLSKVSNKTIETLIILVSKHPDLYDDKSPKFKSANKRARIWEEIATKIKKRGLNSEACKKLWEMQRKSYLYFKKSGTKPPSEKQKIFQKITFLKNTNQGSGSQQPSNENRQQGNENQQANKNNLGAENKDENQGGVQKEGPKTTPTSVVLLSSTNSTQQYATPSVQVNISGVDIHHGIKNRDVPNTRSAKPKLEFEPQSENVSIVDELAHFTTKVRTDLANLPREFQIKAQGEMFQVLSKYKSMAHIATGGIGSSLNTTM